MLKEILAIKNCKIADGLVKALMSHIFFVNFRVLQQYCTKCILYIKLKFPDNVLLFKIAQCLFNIQSWFFVAW